MEKFSENKGPDNPLPMQTGHPGGLRRGLGRLPFWLRNKYILTGSFFAIWMLFIDQKDLISDFERRSTLKELEKSEQHLKQLISESTRELNLLKNNAESIEKYAREKYMMKKDNEDLFIVKSASENK